MKRHLLTILFTIATVSVGSTMMVSAAEISTPMVETISSNTKIQSACDLDYFKGNIELENKVMEVYDYAQELKGQGYSNEQIEKSIDEYLNLSKFAYSAKSAHPFRRNGAPFRLKLSNAQLVN